MARREAELHNPGARLADLLMLPRAADVARFLTAKEGHKFNLHAPLPPRKDIKGSTPVDFGALLAHGTNGESLCRNSFTHTPLKKLWIGPGAVPVVVGRGLCVALQTS